MGFLCRLECSLSLSHNLKVFTRLYISSQCILSEIRFYFHWSKKYSVIKNQVVFIWNTCWYMMCHKIRYILLSPFIISTSSIVSCCLEWTYWCPLKASKCSIKWIRVLESYLSSWDSQSIQTYKCLYSWSFWSYTPSLFWKI